MLLVSMPDWAVELLKVSEAVASQLVVTSTPPVAIVGTQ